MTGFYRGGGIFTAGINFLEDIMKKISIILALAVLFAFASCNPDVVKEEIITDPTDTGDASVIFHDNFTADTTGYYFYSMKEEQYKDLQTVENGVGVLYGGSQFMVFTEGLDLAANDYELAFTFTPSETFSTNAADNKAYSFVGNMGVKNSEGLLSGSGTGIYITFADAEEGKLSVSPTQMNGTSTVVSDVKETVSKGEPVSVRMVFGTENEQTTMKVTGYVGEKEIGSFTHNPVTGDGTVVNGFLFSILGPNGAAYNEKAEDGMPFGTIDDFIVRAIAKAE